MEKKCISFILTKIINVLDKSICKIRKIIINEKIKIDIII